MQKIRKIAITGRMQKTGAVETAKKVIALLEKKKISVEADSIFPVHKKIVELKKAKADLVLCFGGDGTLLHTFHEVGNKMPVMGINCGSRGTLTAFSKENCMEKINEVVAGRFVIEKRSRVKASVDGKIVGEALNEVLVVPEKPGRLLKYHVVVDEADLGLEADDGVIVATPTGSTAHALSAGGPKIVPNAKVFAVVRLNPIDLNRRPLVVNDNSEIKVTRIEHVPAQVILDGQLHFSCRKEIRITKGTDVMLAKLK